MSGIYVINDELDELVPVKLFIPVDVNFSEQVTQSSHHVELLAFLDGHRFSHELHELVQSHAFLSVLFEKYFDYFESLLVELSHQASLANTHLSRLIFFQLRSFCSSFSFSLW